MPVKESLRSGHQSGDVERRGAARQDAAPSTGPCPAFPTTMDLRDHAQRDGTDIVLAREAHGVYRLETTETTPADDISPEGEFPKYGEYVAVERLTRHGKEAGAALLESPHGLALALDRADLIGVGEQFWIRNVAKDQDGAWTFDIVPGLPPGGDQDGESIDDQAAASETIDGP